MATTPQPDNNNHFDKLFWFCVACVAVGLTFLMALCFTEIPKSAERFADNVQGFMEGSIVTAAISFLLGGNIPTVKRDQPTVTQTGDSPSVVIPTADDKTQG